MTLNLDSLCNRVWLMEPSRLAAMFTLLRRKMAGADRFNASSASGMSTVGKVAVLPIYGVIEQRGSFWQELFGGTSTDNFAATFDAALAEPKIKGVIVDIDSPGGTIPGVMELSDRIHSARGQKPVVGIANSMAASAAYWVGSAFDQLYVTPGGSVGSVGVYSMHMDWSKALEDEGVKPTMFAVPEYKAEFNPYEPLSDAAKEYETAEIGRLYDSFVASVAKNRGTGVADVRANYGKGRMVHAAKAVELGMADRIATLDQVVSRIASGRIKAGKYQAEAWGTETADDWRQRNMEARLRSILRTSTPEKSI